MDIANTERYSRHHSLAPIGETGQQKLAEARALIIGAGGLGSPAALYLAAAGVGRLTLADFDTVELSNLQRQIAHTTARVGDLKTHSAREACQAINPDVSIETVDTALEAEELDALVPGMQVVLDCSDNFTTRFAANRACVAHRVPLVSGAAIRFDGQLSVFRPDQPDSPCYACLYGEQVDTGDSCAMAGILGPVVGVIGTLQALEALKVLTGAGTDLTGRLLLFDGLNLEWNEIRLPKNPDCPVCGSL